MKLEEILKTALVISKCTVFKEDKFGNTTVELETTGKVQRLTEIYEKKKMYYDGDGDDFNIGTYDDRLLIANASLSPDTDKQSSTLSPSEEFLKSQRSTPFHRNMAAKSFKMHSKAPTFIIENGGGNGGGVEHVTSTVHEKTTYYPLKIPTVVGSSRGSTLNTVTVPIIGMSTQTPPLQTQIDPDDELSDFKNNLSVSDVADSDLEGLFTTETELESQYPNGKPLLIGYDSSFVNPINSVRLNVDLPQLKGNDHSFIENDDDVPIEHSTHLPLVIRNNSSSNSSSTIDSDSEERFIKVETKLIAIDPESELNIKDGDNDFLINEIQQMMSSQ